MCLLYAAQDLDSVKVKGDDQKAGVEIVKKALQAPIRQITANAGVDGSVVVGKLLEGKKASQGYDAQNEDYVDMFAKGIIDPTKVVRSALQDAASIAGLLITTEAMIADKPEEKDAGPAMPQWVAAWVEWAAWAEWECKYRNPTKKFKKGREINTLCFFFVFNLQCSHLRFFRLNLQKMIHATCF